MNVAADRSNTVRILVCDDHEMLRRVVVAILEEEGFAVVEAPTTHQALAEIARDPPALVIMDVRVGDESGIDAIAEIRADPATASVPVLLMSGESMGGNAGAAPGGADAFVTKPFDLPEFLATVKGLVGAGT